VGFSQPIGFKVGVYLMPEASVLSYLSEDELESLRKMSLGQRVRFLRERMNQVFKGKYSINKVITRITQRGISVTPMALYQLETDRIHSPKSLFLMGVAQELGVSIEFLLQGPDSKDPGELEDMLKQPNIKYGLKALQQLDEQDIQMVMKIIRKFAMSKDLEESTSPSGG
jgi:transcriptional regulator with XRE-family HTH domain